MATTTTDSKRKVSTTVSVPTKSNTIDDVLEAQTFVGAPNTSGVSVNQNAPLYQPDATADTSEFLPYAVTFTWSEEK